MHISLHIYFFLFQSTAAFSKENTYEKLFSYDIKFPNKESADYTNVSKTNDVVLQNVALLLTENFLDLALLNRTHTKPNSYCQLLNKWLNEKELLYTCAGKCKKNKILWDNYIEKLWTALSETKVTVIEESDGQGHEQKQNWCERSRYNNTNPFASEWIPKRCDTDDSEFSESLDQSCAPTAESAGTTSVVPLYVGYVLFAIILIFIFVYKLIFIFVLYIYEHFKNILLIRYSIEH